MKKLVIGTLTTLAMAIVQSTVVARMLPKDIAARIEAIPIQTLTISDQQFLKGDASGTPTTIAGTGCSRLRSTSTGYPHAWVRWH
jgi:hypothetical protein